MFLKKLFSNNIKYTKSDVKYKKVDIDLSFLSFNLKNNAKLFKDIFSKDDTFIMRDITNEHFEKAKFLLVFFDGMVDSDFLSLNLIKPLTTNKSFGYQPNLFDFVMKSVIECNEIEKTKDMKKIVTKMIYGDSVLLVDGYDEAIIISSKGWAKRGIEEPGNETVLRGPREGFTESILQNITLLKRRIISPNLCIETSRIGRESNTKYALVYVDGIVNVEILKELKKRLNKIDIDAIIDSNYIQELIKDNKYSPFKTIGITERPDTVCGKILEGRIAIIVDGTPSVLTLPYLFIEYFQTSDDYYMGFYYASFERMIRICSFLISISIPSIYLALVTYHQKTLPINLLLSISTAKQGVPFPTFIEILLFMISFEVLREASVRMPPKVNQALGVVGGLVIGQAAVEAKLLSAPIIIIIAISGITEIMIPNLKSAVIIYRFILLFLAMWLGLYGYVFGMTYLVMYLYSIKTFNIPYMSPTKIRNYQDIKDTLIRAPWNQIIERPDFLVKNNVKRQVEENK